MSDLADGDDLPAGDHVFRKWHHQHVDPTTGEPDNGAFEFDKTDEEVSVFWDQLIKQEGVLSIKSHWADANGLLKLNVGAIREGDMMSVKHRPNDDHVSHSGIGKLAKPFLKVKARDQLKRIAQVVKRPPTPSKDKGQ